MGEKFSSKQFERRLRYPALDFILAGEISIGALKEKLKQSVPSNSCEIEYFDACLEKTLKWLDKKNYVNYLISEQMPTIRISERGRLLLSRIGKVEVLEYYSGSKGEFWIVDENHAVKQSNDGMFFDMGMTLGSNDPGANARSERTQLKFFRTEDFAPGSKRDVKLYFNGKEYAAVLEEIRNKAHHHRLMWGNDLCDAFQSMFPGAGFVTDFPLMHFERRGEDSFEVYFEGNGNISYEPVPGFVGDGLNNTYSEGGKKYTYGTYYERKKSIRDKAIQAKKDHLVCEACGFDFGKTYGELGKDFIEVHHRKPLSEVKDEHDIDPVKDLALLCSNCHRMVHRKRDKVLGVEELSDIVKGQMMIDRVD